MIRRKILAVLLLVVMTATLTVGCTRSELEFIDIHKEFSSLNFYENSGEITLRINDFARTSNNEIDTFTLDLLQNGLKVYYSGKVNLALNTFDYTFYFADPNTGTQTELTRVLYKNDVLYIKMNQLLKLIGNPDNNAAKLFATNEYLSMTNDDMLLFSSLNKLPFGKLRNNNFFNLSRIIQKSMLGLPKAYQNFNPGIVTKEGNKLTLEMKGANVTELFQNTMEYSIENSAIIGDFLFNFINRLSNKELALLGLEPWDVQLCKEYINMSVAEIEKDKVAALAALNDMRKEPPINKELNKILDSLYFKYSVEKKGDQLYQDALTLTINIEEFDKKLEIELDVLDKIKGIEPFISEIPTTGVISYSEYLTKTASVMEIEVDKDSYFYESAFSSNEGSIDVKIIEGHTYLPLRKVAETFGEKVIWDANARKAYVIWGRNKLGIPGTLIGNRTYIKIRDFELIGYQIQWNDATRTVTIIAPKFK